MVSYDAFQKREDNVLNTQEVCHSMRKLLSTTDRPKRRSTKNRLHRDDSRCMPPKHNKYEEEGMSQLRFRRFRTLESFMMMSLYIARIRAQRASRFCFTYILCTVSRIDRANLRTQFSIAGLVVPVLSFSQLFCMVSKRTERVSLFLCAV
ncbi:unnamed protein product, partial [Amoebophrya sp. A25]|eukprot:GSA25T00013028001.1